MGFKRVFNALYRHYGPQYWWPGETPFEVMVGAILTQNAAWSNVEKAIGNLKAHALLEPEAILSAPAHVLGACLKPSGYFNVKAERLRAYCHWYQAEGGHVSLARRETGALRRALLDVKGVGPETADDILLYAFSRPVFVIDAYTRRLFTRLGMIEGQEGYEELRALFECKLPPQVELYNEYHALIVRHAKDVCRKQPRCGECLLRARCPAGA